MISAKEPKKLPVVLSGEEIVCFLQAVPGLRNRAALTTASGAGLGVSEVATQEIRLVRVASGNCRKSTWRKVLADHILLYGTADIAMPVPPTPSAPTRLRSPNQGRALPSDKVRWRARAAP